MGRIAGIEFLRGIASLLVLLFHIRRSSTLPAAEVPLPWIDYLGFRLDLFFVISGVVMIYVGNRRPDIHSWIFVKHRILRILPPYWLMLIIFIALQNIKSFMETGHAWFPPLLNLFISVFLIPVPSHYLVIIAWTLATQMVFYTLFAYTFYKGRAAVLTTIALWGLAGQIYRFVPHEPDGPLNYIFNTMVLEFLFGMLIGIYTTRGGGGTRSRWAAVVFGAIWVYGLYYFKIDPLSAEAVGREITVGIPAACFVYAFTGIKGKLPLPFKLLAEASFMLYLFHLVIMPFTSRLTEKLLGLDDAYNHASGMLLTAFLTVIGALAVTRFIDRPYRKIYRRLISKDYTQEPVATASS